MAQYNAQRCVLKVFSGGFNTMSVVNLLDWKLANHTSVQWCGLLHFFVHSDNVFWKVHTVHANNRTGLETEQNISLCALSSKSINKIWHNKSWQYDLLCLMYSLFLMRSMHYSFQLNQNMSTDCQQLTHFVRHRFLTVFCTKEMKK